MTTLGFIGAGKMAEALMRALIQREILTPAGIIASDKVAARLQHLGETLHITAADDNPAVLRRADVVFLAVKPQDIPAVLDEIAPEATDRHIIISIAAGVTIRRLEQALPAARIVRVMPNTPCLVSEMAAGFAVGRHVTAEDTALVRRLLKAAGEAVELEEALLDAVTGLSGSGPAFVAYFIDSLAAAGISQGMAPDTARRLAVQTVLGTAKLLRDTGITPEQLIAMVSSPNGTTVAGRAVLEASDLRTILDATVAAATARSRELGRG